MSSYFGGVAKYAGLCNANESCYGGIARLKHFVRRLKKEQKNTLLLNGGDNFQGSGYFKLFGWKIVSDLLKDIPFDAMSLGNHEFDNTPSVLINYLKKTTYPTICANIDTSSEPELDLLIRKSIVKKVDGKRIGIVGYVTKDTKELSYPGENIDFLDEVESVREEAKRLRNEENVDIVIALGHSGYVIDQDIARLVEEVDVVVGGHSNTFLYTGKPPMSWPPVEGPYPTMVKQENSEKTVPVVQAFTYGIYVGNLTVVFDRKTNKLLRAEGNPILITSDMPEDKESKRRYSFYEKEFEEKVNNVLSETSMMLEGGDICRLRECSGGNFFTDLILINLMEKTSKLKRSDSWTYSSIVFLNAGSIRSSIKPGLITVMDVYTMFPYQNYIVIIEVSGKDLKQSLEDAVKGVMHGNKPGGFPQLSGIQVEYNLSQPINHRVMNVLVRCHHCPIPKFYHLDPEATYPIILPDYCQTGGDGITAFKKYKATYEGDVIADVIVDAVRGYNYFTDFNDRVLLHGHPPSSPRRR